MLKKSYLIFIALLISLFLATSSFGYTTNWQYVEDMKSRLVVGYIDPFSGRIWGGLQFELGDKWKLYWKNPGSVGFPMELSWQGSENIENVSLEWPVPKRSVVSGFETIAYSDGVILPLMIDLKNYTQPANLKLNINYSLCGSVCIPVEQNFDLSFIRDRLYMPSDNQKLIIDSLKKLPLPFDETLYKIERFAYNPVNRQVELVVVSQTPFFTHDKLDVFFESHEDMQFYHTIPQFFDSNRRLVFHIPISFSLDEPETWNDPKLSFVLQLGDNVMEVKHKPLLKSSYEWGQFFFMFFMAFLGGIVLNFMPCVLPVLSLKVFSLINSNQSSERSVRVSFAASSAGIMISFIVLGLIVLFLKQLGVVVGWGMQFQQPIFLIMLAVLLTFFACNLWGMYQIYIPQKLVDFTYKYAYKYNYQPKSSEYKILSSFLMGVLVTILSTPCTAPFLGTALGFALSRNAFEILIIFLAIGLGLAFPYLCFATFPKWAKYLPKPGGWMERLKIILGFFLFGTALWLMSVLMEIVPLYVAASILAFLFLIILFFKRRMTWSKQHKLLKFFVLLLMTFFVFLPSMSLWLYTKGAEDSIVWQKFEPGKIPELIEEGRIVFVNATAEWCLNCKVNDLILEHIVIKKAFKENDIYLMRADWTKPSTEVLFFLKNNNRSGIPFNAIYTKKNPEGLILPELLSKNIVMNYLEKVEVN